MAAVPMALLERFAAWVTLQASLRDHPGRKASSVITEPMPLSALSPPLYHSRDKGLCGKNIPPPNSLQSNSHQPPLPRLSITDPLSPPALRDPSSLVNLVHLVAHSSC